MTDTRPTIRTPPGPARRSSTAERVLLVGCGFAGRRFLDVLAYLRHEAPGLVELVGTVDRDPAKRAALDGHGLTFASVAAALEATAPTVAVIAVGEPFKFEVLSALDGSGVEAVLCEKPLTRTPEEAEALRGMLRHRFVSLNLVERFSPVIDRYFDWRRAHPRLTPTRVEFFWGKHRVKDPRPTMGVCSELIHPIDLVDHVFGTDDRPEVRGAIRIESDMAVDGGVVTDGLSLLMATPGYPIIGHSSFAWAARDRRLVAHLSDGARLFRVCFEFDHPRWDCDRLWVDRIDRATGRAERDFEYATTNADFPAELDQVFKVMCFVRASLAAFRGGTQACAELVGYDRAVELQHRLAALERAAARCTTRFSPPDRAPPVPRAGGV